jgi:glycosyltransferase involved in cell wall biosynthesis
MDGYKTVLYKHKHSILVSGMPSSRQLIKALGNACAEFDIIHVHGLWNPVATFSMRLLRKKGRPYCLTPHGMLDPVVLSRNRWKKIPWSLLWERANVEGAALLHWTAEAEHEKACKSGLVFAKSVVAPNLIDVGEWATLPPRESFEKLFPQTSGKEVILFAGRINWLKNIDQLIRALKIVREKRPSAMLVCAGPDNDNYQPGLESLAENLGLKDSVLFAGMLKGEDLKSAFARAQVFALVSKRENFGMAAAEALAAGLPSVLSQGVDMGREWPAYDFIARVEAEPAGIAAGILAMLERSSRVGTPDPGARALAAQQWGLSSTEKLVAAYRSVL